MEYAKIIAITGLPGLYEMMNSKGDGAIVKSLDDQSTKFVSGRVHQFTHLESIEVYTERENVNLVEVLNAMKDSPEKLPDEKDGKALQAYFKKVYPALDFDRVYASDMKKMVKWFTVLKNNDVEIKLSEPEEEEEPVEEPNGPEAPVEEPGEKPVKKVAPKKEEKKEAPAKPEAKQEKPKEEKKPKAAAKEEKEEKKEDKKPKAKPAETKKPAAKKSAKAAPDKKAAKKKAK